MRFTLLSGAAAGLCLALAGGALAQSALPSGMVFFVEDQNCPTGSLPVDDAKGRLLLATKNPTEWGQTFGAPAITGLNERDHTHEVTLSLTLEEKGISGASSCCNNRATSKGKHSKTVTTGGATSDLPFVSLLVCKAN
ncbi:hypothetical protein [Dinoroseobacter sp. S124A]|uniref:hypothetical protein n=1 Tax=Dinoroseobacter sp. S124A TaxID=3415128 RepID=UPI003C7B3CF5